MNIVAKMIDIINSDTYYGTSERIEMMKGKYKLNKTFLEYIEQLKRDFYMVKIKIKENGKRT